MRIWREFLMVLAGVALAACGGGTAEDPPFQQFASGGPSETSPAPAPASTDAPRAIAGAQSPATPLAQPTSAPAAASTPTGATGCTAIASVDNATPGRNSTVVVTGRLECPGESPAGAPMTASWKFKSTTSTCEGAANDAGIATCSRAIGGATAGFLVEVTVTFVYGGARYSAATGFTPR